MEAGDEPMTVALIYHDIAPRDATEGVGFAGPLASRYKLSPDQFESHLDEIEATAASVGTISGSGGDPDVVLTFDDGGGSALLAAELLERRGWRGHFFITTSRVGAPGFLDIASIRELVERGHVVGSHSHTHPTYMGKLARGEIDREWTRSRAELGEILGVPPATASVPGGFLSDDVVAGAAAAGYSLLFTSEPETVPTRKNGLAVYGRFTVRSDTSPGRVRGYVTGVGGARSRTRLAWRAKRLAKRASAPTYQALRHLRSLR